MLEPATHLLESRGIGVELMEAARIITPDLAAAARQVPDGASWVLCVSEAFNPGRAARMHTILRARDVPEDRVFRVEVDWRDPMALIERLQDAGALGGRKITAPHRALGSQRREGPPPRAGNAPEIDEDLPTVVGPAPTPPPPPRDPGSVRPVPTASDPEEAEVAEAPVTVVASPGVLTPRRAALGAAAGLVLLGGLGVLLWPGTQEETPEAVATAVESADEPPPVEERVVEEPDGEAPAEGDDHPVPVPPWAHEAAAEGKLTIYEDLVFAPPMPEKKSFHDASRMCAELAEQESAAWRMPRLGEIHRLTREKVLPREVYWSGTESDGFGNRGLVWSAKKMRAAPIAKGWKGGFGICVLDLSGPAE